MAMPVYSAHAHGYHNEDGAHASQRADIGRAAVSSNALAVFFMGMSSHPNAARALLPVFALFIFAGSRLLAQQPSPATAFVPQVTIVADLAATQAAVPVVRVAQARPAATVEAIPEVTAALPTETIAAAPAAATAVPVTPEPPAAAVPSAPALPASALIEGVVHQQQTWNNCGPANISMLLQLYGRTETQRDAARVLKPVRDDKNVSPNEMVAYAQLLGFRARWIAGADIELIKAFVANGLPVIAESWYIPEPNDEMGHYELVHGYEGDTLIVDDSYEGPNKKVAAREWDALWKVFNRTLIVVWREDQDELARSLLGERWDERRMHELALAAARTETELDPNDKFAWFNIGTSLLALGDPPGATTAFDKADSLKLPWRMLWYQHGIYEAHFLAGNHEQVIKLANRSLKATGDLEESYYWRGRAQQALGRKAEAQRDFGIAAKLNPSYAAAVEALKTSR
jgi:tetratricopeptide (TPR) repeat protein